MLNHTERQSGGGINGYTDLQKPDTTALSKAIIHDFTGFDLRLRSKKGGGTFIVDMYVTKPDNPGAIVPINQEKALDRFRGHIRTIDANFPGRRVPPDWVLNRANLVSAITYREEEDRVSRGEEKMPYREYLMLVSGVEPTYIPEEKLRGKRRQLVDKIRRTGSDIPNVAKTEDVKEALRYYNDRNRLQNRGEVERVFQRKRDRYMRQLGQRLGEDLTPVDFRIVWKEADAFWMMWERLRLEGNELWANFHPRNRAGWTEAVVDMYAVHEPIHFIAGYLQGEEISRGNLDPATGIIPIPGPSCLHSEGLAVKGGELARLDTTLDGKVATDEYVLRYQALNNGLYLVENGMPVDEAIENIRDYMLTRSDPEIRQLLVEGTTKPFERAYLPNYGLGSHIFEELDEQLGEGMRNVYLPQLFKTPMTYDQLMNPTLRLGKRLFRS